MAWVSSGGRYTARRRASSARPYRAPLKAITSRPYKRPQFKVSPRAAGAFTAGRIAYIGYKYLKTRKMPKLTSTVPIGTGSTTSYYKRGTAPRGVVAKVLKSNQPNYDVVIQASRMSSSGYGKQSVTSFGFNLYADYLRYCTNIGTLAAQVPISKLYVGKTTVTSTFTNQDISTAYMHIYEIEPRFHIASSTNGSPSNLWDVGLEAESGTSNAFYQDVYQVPFSSQKFCLFHKINKIIKVELAQGQSHKHTSSYNINKCIYGALSESYQVQKAFTMYQMIVCSGTPLNDSTVVGNVSTSTVAIDVVQHVKTMYTYSEDNKVNYYYNNTLPIVTTGRTISIGSGSIANESEA